MSSSLDNKRHHFLGSMEHFFEQLSSQIQLGSDDLTLQREAYHYAEALLLQALPGAHHSVPFPIYFDNLSIPQTIRFDQQQQTFQPHPSAAVSSATSTTRRKQSNTNGPLPQNSNGLIIGLFVDISTTRSIILKISATLKLRTQIPTSAYLVKTLSAATHSKSPTKHHVYKFKKDANHENFTPNNPVSEQQMVTILSKSYQPFVQILHFDYSRHTISFQYKTIPVHIVLNPSLALTAQNFWGYQLLNWQCAEHLLTYTQCQYPTLNSINNSSESESSSPAFQDINSVYLMINKVNLILRAIFPVVSPQVLQVLTIFALNNIPIAEQTDQIHPIFLAFQDFKVSLVYLLYHVSSYIVSHDPSTASFSIAGELPHHDLSDTNNLISSLLPPSTHSSSVVVHPFYKSIPPTALIMVPYTRLNPPINNTPVENIPQLFYNPRYLLPIHTLQQMITLVNIFTPPFPLPTLGNRTENNTTLSHLQYNIPHWLNLSQNNPINVICPFHHLMNVAKTSNYSQRVKLIKLSSHMKKLIEHVFDSISPLNNCYNGIELNNDAYDNILMELQLIFANQINVKAVVASDTILPTTTNHINSLTSTALSNVLPSQIYTALFSTHASFPEEDLTNISRQYLAQIALSPCSLKTAQGLDTPLPYDLAKLLFAVKHLSLLYPPIF